MHALTHTAPDMPPLDVVTNGSYFSVTVSWNPVPCFSRNGPITGYLVIITGGSIGMNRTVTATNTNFDGLMKFTPYNISIAAFNIKGMGPFSETITVVLKEGVVCDLSN